MSTGAAVCVGLVVGSLIVADAIRYLAKAVRAAIPKTITVNQGGTVYYKVAEEEHDSENRR